MKKQKPASLWVAIRTSGVPLTIVLNGVLIAGLVYGQKWAYILVLVFSVLGVAVSLSKGIEQGLVVLVVNAIIVIPMIISTSFIPRPREGSTEG